MCIYIYIHFQYLSIFPILPWILSYLILSYLYFLWLYTSYHKIYVSERWINSNDMIYPDYFLSKFPVAYLLVHTHRYIMNMSIEYFQISKYILYLYLYISICSPPWISSRRPFGWPGSGSFPTPSPGASRLPTAARWCWRPPWRTIRWRRRVNVDGKPGGGCRESMVWWILSDFDFDFGFCWCSLIRNFTVMFSDFNGNFMVMFWF